MRATIEKVEKKGYHIKKVGDYYAVIRNLDNSVSSLETTIEAAKKVVEELTAMGF